MTVAAPQAPCLEVAHVLFIDVVGYSKLAMEQQQSVLKHLEYAVRNTPQYVRAQNTEELICLPTGDGMALVFFRDPEAAVHCAMELSQELRYPHIDVRMGVHTGPVYRVADINANRNVAGGGINLAQRVMDCGDAGHILISSAVAEVLGQLGAWKACFHDLGEAEVKHGAHIHLFNLYTADIGNPNPPHGISKAASTGEGRGALAIPHLPWIVAVTGLAVIVGVMWWMHGSGRSSAAPDPHSKAIESTAPRQSTAGAAAPKQAPGKPKPTAATAARKQASRATTNEHTAASPLQADLSGNYTGQFISAARGASSGSIVFQEKDGVVTGCLRTSNFGFAGPLRGIAQGTHFVASVNSSSGRAEIQGQLVGDELRGSYTSSGQPVQRVTYILQRQRNTGARTVADCPLL